MTEPEPEPPSWSAWARALAREYLLALNIACAIPTTFGLVFLLGGVWDLGIPLAIVGGVPLAWVYREMRIDLRERRQRLDERLAAVEVGESELAKQEELLAALRPREGIWVQMVNGEPLNSIPIRWVETDEPGRFAPVGLDGKPIAASMGDHISADVVGPGQSLVIDFPQD